MTNTFNLEDIPNLESSDASGVWQNISMEVLDTTPVSVPVFKPQNRKKRKLTDTC